MSESEERITRREEGRVRACEGLLRSRFGRRSTCAGENAIRKLRAESRRSSARVSGGRFRWLWVSVAACLAIIVGAHLINLRQTEQFVEVLVAHIQKTEPNVKVIRGADGRVVAAIVGMELFPGDRIETKKGEKVVFGYPNEETSVTVGDGKRESALVIGTVEKGKRLRLEKGMIDASVAPQPADRNMVIETPHAKAEIVGTRFSVIVERESSNSTWVDVDEGLVRFTRLADAGAIEVATGQFAVAGAKAADYALRTYPAGIGYVDGPVMFEDDFEEGFGNFEPGIIEDGKSYEAYMPLDSGENPFVSIRDAERNGGSSRVALVDARAWKRKGMSIGLFLKTLISAESYRFEHMRFLFPLDGGRYKGSRGKEVGRWCNQQIEWITYVDVAGRKVIEITHRSDGVVTHHSKDPYQPFERRVCATTDGARMMIDNVVIRQLIPRERKAVVAPSRPEGGRP